MQTDLIQVLIQPIKDNVHVNLFDRIHRRGEFLSSISLPIMRAPVSDSLHIIHLVLCICIRCILYFCKIIFYSCNRSIGYFRNLNCVFTNRDSPIKTSKSATWKDFLRDRDAEHDHLTSSQVSGLNPTARIYGKSLANTSRPMSANPKLKQGDYDFRSNNFRTVGAG